MTPPTTLPPAPAEDPASPADGDNRRVAMVSLGCPMNPVDSEKMLGLLAEDGVMPVPADAMEAGEADAAIVNTCGFLEASKAESRKEINKAAQLKRHGRLKRIVVAGCLVQRHRAKILKWCPDVNAVIGVFDRDRIVRAVRGEAEALQQKHDEKVGMTQPQPVYSLIAANAGFARTDPGVAPSYCKDDAARFRLTPGTIRISASARAAIRIAPFAPSLRSAARCRASPWIASLPRPAS